MLHYIHFLPGHIFTLFSYSGLFNHAVKSVLNMEQIDVRFSGYPLSSVNIQKYCQSIWERFIDILTAPR